MITVDAIAAALDRLLNVERYADDQGGVFLHSPRAVRRIGLALEPWEGIGMVVEEQRLDALFLHRPWKLAPGELPADVGVLAYHLAFDEHLTLGFNPRLAVALNLGSVAPFGEKQGRAIGMIGDMPPTPFEQFAECVRAIFGGHEPRVPVETVERVAVVGAMTDELVRDAAAAGANMYITGQLRQPAAQALADTGMGVLEVGHRRSELWGLRALGGLLRERWAALDVVLLEDRRERNM